MKERKRNSRDTITPGIIAVCILMIAIILALGAGSRRFRDDTLTIIDERQEFLPEETEPPTEYEETIPSESETRDILEANAGMTPVPAGYTTERKSESDVHDGLLIQVDENYPFDGEVKLVGFQNKNEDYHLKHLDLQAHDDTVRAMNALAEDYVIQTGQTNLLVYSSVEIYDVQGSLCPDLIPDRSTGYCLDLAFLNEDGTLSVVNNGNSGWLRENAWKYGFIFSSIYAYHIRYVGRVNAFLMHEQNLTLPEWLKEIRKYRVSSPYEFVFEGILKKLYFVPAAAFGSTDVPVPEKENYLISGNNTDGFIVCADAD